MKGLDSYPTWVRETIGCALLVAGVLTWSSTVLSVFLFVMGVGLIIPNRKKPSA